MLETPPRTRRKPFENCQGFTRCRNTSAYAEKTGNRSYRKASCQKHLRVRGENTLTRGRSPNPAETPPRTRRKLIMHNISKTSHRNTSAYAEKTRIQALLKVLRKKHLRVRGENLRNIMSQVRTSETPPRTRRKPTPSYLKSPFFRNTSAYAEKTNSSASSSLFDWKHLRVRGENRNECCARASGSETPPRTRRKRRRHQTLFCNRRNTSAYAEKTRLRNSGNRPKGKHLRVRGENDL